MNYYTKPSICYLLMSEDQRKLLQNKQENESKFVEFFKQLPPRRVGAIIQSAQA